MTVRFCLTRGLDTMLLSSIVGGTVERRAAKFWHFLLVHLHVFLVGLSGEED